MATSRYHCEWTEKEGERIVRLRDDRAGAEAEVAVSFGMNVVRFALRGDDVVLPPPSMAALRATPFRYGVPALSPPGRTSFGRFPHRGAVVRLPAEPGKHNMHGELGALPWRPAGWGADAERGAYVEARYAYRDDPDPERFARFPFDLRYTVAIRLKDGKLSLEGAVRNAGVDAAPFALGYHPYFVCDRRRTTLRIPALAQWPIGRDGVASGLPADTKLAAALREGMPADAMEGNLHFLQCRDAAAGRDGAYECFLEDRGGGRRIRFRADGLFSVLALFLPPWGEAVSLEPHSCIPDAANLPWDAAETGWLELEAGEERRFEWSIDAEDAAYE